MQMHKLTGEQGTDAVYHHLLRTSMSCGLIATQAGIATTPPQIYAHFYEMFLAANVKMENT